MPRVSIIIPTHNRPQLLPRAVASAFAAGSDVEVVVVDDASTDETAEVCQTLKGIKYLRVEQNVGVAGARNAGVIASSADYIALLDDDDVRLPETIDLQLTQLERSDAGLIYGQARLTGALDRVDIDSYPQSCPSGDVFWQLLTQNFIPSGSVIFRRSCLQTIGLFNPAIAGIDDWDLWIRIAAAYPVVALEEPVVIWRRPSPSSDQGSACAVDMVAKSTRQFRQEWSKMARVLQQPLEMKRKAASEFSQNMARHLVCEALRSFSYGRPMNANHCLFAAFRFHSLGLLTSAMRLLSTKRVVPLHFVS